MASLKKRGNLWYAQYYLGRTQKRISLQTTSYAIAKEKLRRLESGLAQGDDNPLPSRTPIAEVLTAYVEHVRTIKTAKSAQTDIYYLREAFGPVCDGLKITSRIVTEASRKRCLKADGAKKPRPSKPIEAACLEQITTAQISEFIAGKVRSRELAPKTANRYREILHRLFAWAMDERRVRMPSDRNPVAKVERYKERAPEIRFLTLQQIEEQLQALAFKPRLKAMVATLIYAGLRREELVWLTIDDIDKRTGPHGMIRIRAKTIDGQSWQPKTKVNRAVPISRTLRAYLDAYTPAASDHGWFFPSPEGRLWIPDNFSRDLREANSEANLVWGCLDYRHTFGSQLAMNGESLFKIATLMGNSPEICRRHYAALVPESLASSVEFVRPTAKTA